MLKSIAEMQDEVYVNNKSHGWYDKPRTFDADVALLHSEISEAYEAYRKNMMTSTLGSVDGPPDYNPSSLPAELADIFIRLLDTCYRYGINLEVEFDRKMDYNRRRSYRRGNKIV